MAAQDYSANLMYPMAQNNSTDKFNLTIEKFEGTVHETILKASALTDEYRFMPLIGTDAMSNNAMGLPSLAKVVPGIEPLGQNINVGKMMVYVRSPIIARVTTPMLADVQTHLDIKGKTPGNFGKRIAQHLDQVMFVQINKSIGYDHPAAPTGGANTLEGTGGILAQGAKVTLSTALDELDSAKLTTAMFSVAQTLAERDIDITGADGKLYMLPAQYFTLLKNKDLLNSDINKPNGSYAHAAIDVVSGMPVIMTNRMPSVADSFGFPATAESTAALYGSSTDTSYDISAIEAKGIAYWANGDTIMVAQSIPLTTDVYWDKRLLCWFIDAYMAIGAAPNRTDTCGGVWKA